jgi:DNA-binding transcriptional LysR family regulator
MEYVCGMRLFERGKGRLQPQEAGTLFGEVQRAYHGMERVRQAVEEIRLHRGVQVSVICQPGLAQSLLPHVCARPSSTTAATPASALRRRTSAAGRMAGGAAV